jgi:sugar fermentation stimulation protein A
MWLSGWISFCMLFPSPLRRGVLLKRYRRFLADIRCEDGTTVTAHCPSSGTLRGCAEPGSTVFVSDSGDASRRHPLTWEITEVRGRQVCINTPLCRRLMIDAISERRIPSLAFFHELQREAGSGTSGTVDMVLHGMERNAFVNLYHVTWAEDGVALFPDAAAARIATSVQRLAEIARHGHQATAFFLVQRDDCTMLKPAEAVDRSFMKAMLSAQSAGVELLVHATDITRSGVTLGHTLSLSLA